MSVTSHMIRCRAVLVLAILAGCLLLAACGLPVPGSEPTPVTAVPSPTRRPFSLPPTWTPTFIPTPVPATITPLPSRTPSITPTPGDADRCTAFAVFSHPAAGARLVINQVRSVTFIWEYPVVGGASLFTVGHAGIAGGEGLIIPGPNTVVVTLPLSALDGPGPYRWSIAPIGADGQPLRACEASGRFALVLRPREENRYPIP